MRASGQRFVWGGQFSFSRLSTKYCTLVLPPRVGIRKIPRPILRPFTNCSSVLVAFQVSIRLSSHWPRSLATRVRRCKASLCYSPRAISVLIQLTAQKSVTSKGCLRSQSNSAATHCHNGILKGLKSKHNAPGLGQLGRSTFPRGASSCTFSISSSKERGLSSSFPVQISCASTIPLILQATDCISHPLLGFLSEKT